MKKKVLNLLLILVLVIGVVGCGNKKVETKSDEHVIKENKNKGVVREQTVDGISFTNTSLKTVDGMSTIETTITNNTDSEYTKEKFTIIIKDKNGDVIQKMPGYINDTIPAGGSIVINSGIDVDLSNAYSVEYEAEE